MINQGICITGYSLENKKNLSKSTADLDPVQKLLVWSETIEGTVRLLTLIKEGMKHGQKAAAAFIEHLERSPPSDDASGNLRRAWEKARERESHIIGMLHYFIDLMKRRRLDRDTLNLPELLQEIASELDPGTENGSSRIVVSVDGSPRPVNLDRRYLKHALMNLVDNALYFVGDQGRVGLKCSENGSDAASIEVVDDGPGIPEEIRPFIFRPFFSTKAPEAMGCGLGLPIAQLLLFKLGGLVELDSKFREGTRFVIRVPYDEVKAD